MNTSQQMGALSLAALAAVAAYASGVSGSSVAALNFGYHAAFLPGAGYIVLAALLRLPIQARPRWSGTC